jgi:lysophospholipase L1-like esterase
VAVRGATLLSALQPTLYLKQPLSPAELRMMTDASGYGATVNFTVQNYLRLRQDLADLSASEPNVVFQDLSAAFDGLAEEMFGDNVHFYKQGYAIVADRLAPTIASAVRAKRPTLVSGGP